MFDMRGCSRNLPEEFSPQFITETFFPQYVEMPRLINMGKCYDWAYFAFCLYDDVILWTTDCHAWIEKNELFYDSEVTKGEAEFESLSCNSNYGWDELPPQQMEIQEFKDFWNYTGAGRRFHWGQLWLEMIEKGFLPKRR
jgi:hypothetical protein